MTRRSTMARMLPFLLAHGGLLAGGFACMVVLALTTMGYAWVAGPLLHFLTSGETEGLAVVLRLFVEDPHALDRGRLLLYVPLLLLGIGLLKGAAYLGHFYWMGLLAQKVVVDLRIALFRRLLGLTPAELATRRSGDLLSRFGPDLMAVETALHIALPTYLRDALQVAVLLALCVHLDPKLSLIAFGILPAAVVPLVRLARRLRKVSRQGQRRVGKLSSLVHEAVAGIRVVQAYGMEDHLSARFAEENARWVRLQKRSLAARGIASPAMELLTMVGAALALAFAVRALHSGSLLGAEVLSFLAAVALLFQPAKNLGKVGGIYLQGLAGADRIFEALDQSPAPREGGIELALLREAIVLENVRVRHGDRVALDGIDLVIRRGEFLALVGPSGGGKSTLLELLGRFLDPTEGRVLFDGVDLRDADLGSLRRQIAYVPQEPHLFDESVRDNVREGADADDAAVWAALEAAGAAAFVRALPGGLDFRVGEGGERLSGGQRQRIAIARAILRDAPILLLDEATSGLDVETEQEVQAALELLAAGRTVVMVAHRLGTVRGADRICVIAGGRIVEEGTHDELWAAGGTYRRLVELQDHAMGEVA
ncbi:MAG TPA: ABC transporter ATP-binding protein [Fredinandcohnia sp.]|nr:ABC transporter ATP-binding protein [Fredinandcohnia sp.]